MTNLSAVARTATYFDDVAAQNRKVQSEGGRGFFWDTEDIAKQAVNSPGTGIEIVKMDDIIQKLPGGNTIVSPLSGKFNTKEIADGIKNANQISGGLTAARFTNKSERLTAIDIKADAIDRFDMVDHFTKEPFVHGKMHF